MGTDVGEPAALLGQINQQYGTAFTLVGRCRDGVQGAYAIADQAGRSLILKWKAGADDLSKLEAAVSVTNRLREVGYPTPQYVLAGAVGAYSFSIQEALPGVPMRLLTPAYLPRLIELNRFQDGRAIPGPRDWPRYVVETVMVGGEGYCLPDTLRTFSPATAELLGVLRGLVTAHADDDCRTDDIVHFDFTAMNVLVNGGQVSGVIDWEGCCAGDRAFDLATLLFYAYDVPELRERLWHHALELAAPGPLSVYLAHLILRQVDWSLRHHDEAIVGHYLGIAGALVRDIKRLLA
jgi:hypothetical protein